MVAAVVAAGLFVYWLGAGTPPLPQGSAGLTAEIELLSEGERVEGRSFRAYGVSETAVAGGVFRVRAEVAENRFVKSTSDYIQESISDRQSVDEADFFESLAESQKPGIISADWRVEVGVVRGWGPWRRWEWFSRTVVVERSEISKDGRSILVDLRIVPSLGESPAVRLTCTDLAVAEDERFSGETRRWQCYHSI